MAKLPDDHDGLYGIIVHMSRVGVARGHGGDFCKSSAVSGFYNLFSQSRVIPDGQNKETKA